MASKEVFTFARRLLVAAGTVVASQGLSASATTLGQTVTNIASFTYEDADGGQVTVLTNPAHFVIEAAPTASTIEFFRYSPNAPDASLHVINGSDYSPSGETDGPFISMTPPAAIGGISQRSSSSGVPLLPASLYNSGELMFVRVVDAGHNGDPDAIETVVVTIDADNGDTITLRLYESGPNTGVFWAYVPSTRNASNNNDASLSAGQGTQLTATYVDSFDATEISIDTALIDPYGRVFNGFTGEMVSNARISLVDYRTGELAQVFGVDGVSSFPAEYISGSSVTDESGLSYALRPGEFQFPIVPAGEYVIRVEPPEGLSFASALSPDDFTGLTNAPFTVVDASYGQTFVQETTGPLLFDIPLDAESELVVSKSALQSTGDVGDFISYSVNIDNRGNAGVPVKLRDIMPNGFRYVSGSTRLNGQSFAEPGTGATGQELIFDLGPLSVAQNLELSYVLQIGAGAELGESTNSIVAINGNGENVSNTARAAVTIREDLLRSRSTLVGRISEGACNGDEEWAKSIKQGTGVKGVRLYMETGAYAISDEDGLYHFEGVTPGTHVVQLDEETLPKGYEPMVCEESTRYADNTTSKFVEIQGGGLWRANFYLQRTGDIEEEEAVAAFNDQTEYKDFDSDWLGAQSPELAWVYPSPDRTPSIPSTNVGIKHGPNEKVSLSLNGQPVALANFSARDSDKTRSVMISRWRGIDLLEGRNEFVATVTDLNGNSISTIKNDVHFVKNIARAATVPDQSVLVADGRTHPELAIRLEDEAGRPVHAGRVADIEIASPYRVYTESRIEGAEELVSPLSARANIVAGPDGIARIKLEPTLQTGKVTAVVTLDDGRKVTLFMYLEPEKRDWILVGLAEGSAAYNSLKNKTAALASGAAEDLVTDGRVAFFAKGMVKGDWLMTLAVDTDKRRGDRDGDFNTEIDPNAYYTLYGDRSYNEFEAASRYPVYLKLEKKSFYAMFGDFNTNITEGKLTRYSRHLSGIKAEYLGETFQATGFAAETNQGFAKDEIAANGTSGPYQLSNTHILANSETVTIETRDRVRADQILETRTLLRHLDYTLDYVTGEIIFRLPVDVSDTSFNPNVIVADYETVGDAERNLTYGGRVQKQILDGRVQIGSTFVHEGGSNSVAGGSSDLIGAEVIAQVGKGTEVRAEYAITQHNGGASNTTDKTSNAYLAEIVHTSENLSADAYIRQEEGGFGLRQRASNTAETRRYGANVAYKFDEFEDEKTGRRGERNVTASVYKEDNLGTGDRRTLGELTVNHEGEKIGASAGIRQVKDKIALGPDRESLLALIRARYTSKKHGATFQVSHEQPIRGNDNVEDFPRRTRLSVDKTITSKARVRISHDILDGENTGGNNTAIGVNYAPWNGTEISAGTDMITSDSGRRIGATVGVDQQFQINEKWSASLGVSNRQVLSNSGSVEQVAPDAAVSSFETNESNTAAYVGVGYKNETTSASARLEAREATSSKTYTAAFGAAREVSEDLSFAGALRATRKEDRPIATSDTNVVRGTDERIDGRLGLSWRPRDEGLILLNRFDVSYQDNVSGEKTFKVVNNLTANAKINDRWQISGNHGIKYLETRLGGTQHKSTTHLAGVETRYDITERIDLGLNGSVLYSSGSDTMSYAYGPSIGVSPVDNVWVSLGYNVAGYKDGDFSAAEYSQRGAYIKFRVKFDQKSARGLLDIISPNNR